MCFHLRMAQFSEILNPYVAVSYKHGRPYYEKNESCKQLECLLRILYILGFPMFSSKDDTV